MIVLQVAPFFPLAHAARKACSSYNERVLTFHSITEPLTSEACTTVVHVRVLGRAAESRETCMCAVPSSLLPSSAASSRAEFHSPTRAHFQNVKTLKNAGPVNIATQWQRCALVVSEFAERTCGPDGKWRGRTPSDTRPNGWTNYMGCYSRQLMQVCHLGFQGLKAFSHTLRLPAVDLSRCACCMANAHCFCTADRGQCRKKSHSFSCVGRMVLCIFCIGPRNLAFTLRPGLLLIKLVYLVAVLMERCQIADGTCSGNPGRWIHLMKASRGIHTKPPKLAFSLN